MTAREWIDDRIVELHEQCQSIKSDIVQCEEYSNHEDNIILSSTIDRHKFRLNRLQTELRGLELLEG